jgi:hypothetical protein
MLPVDIVNKILVYVGELNNSVIITQYNPITHKESYKINFHSDLLWRIRSTLVMKRHYPIRNPANLSNNRELYQYGIPHYENQLRLKLIT